MRNANRVCLVIYLMAIAVSAANAQLVVGGNMLDNCAKIGGHIDDENYGDARTAARLCLEGLDAQLEGQVGQHFLKEIAGWKRQNLEQNNAMGFSNTSADYSKNGVYVTVSLTGGMGGGGGGFGALAGLAQFGLLQSGKKISVGGQPGSVDANGVIIVTMEDGSFLNFSSSTYGDADEALAGMGDLVNAFPVAAINQTLSEGS